MLLFHQRKMHTYNICFNTNFFSTILQGAENKVYTGRVLSEAVSMQRLNLKQYSVSEQAVTSEFQQYS